MNYLKYKKLLLVTISVFVLGVCSVYANKNSDENLTKNSISKNQANNQYKKTIKIAAHYKCPYYCKPENKNFLGYAVELIRESLSIYDIEIEYSLMSFKLAKEKMALGEIDAILDLSSEHGLENILLSKSPIHYNDFAIYANDKNNLYVHNIEDLLSRKLIIIKDYDITHYISHFISSLFLNQKNLKFFSSDHEIVDSLLFLSKNKSYLFIEDICSTEYILKNNNINNIKRISFLNELMLDKNKFASYIGFDAKNPMSKYYKKKLEEGLNALKASNKISILQKKYNIIPF